jgi:8-oxo-dGTP pyrophosphatase MutT (NUDIX family)
VVVDDDGRVLVIQRRDNGRWEATGGVLELDETFEAASVARSPRRPASTWPSST